MLALGALSCAAPVVAAGLAETAAGGAGRVAGRTGGFCTLGFVGRGLEAAAFALVPRAAAVLRVVATRFFAALFFRVVVRLGPAARLVPRLPLALAFVFFRAVVRGLRRVAGFRRARVLERAAIVDLPRGGRARMILRSEEKRGQRKRRRSSADRSLDRDHRGDAGHLLAERGLEGEAERRGLSRALYARPQEGEFHRAIVLDVHELDSTAVRDERRTQAVERCFHPVAQGSRKRRAHILSFRPPATAY